MLEAYKSHYQGDYQNNFISTSKHYKPVQFYIAYINTLLLMTETFKKFRDYLNDLSANTTAHIHYAYP